MDVVLEYCTILAIIDDSFSKRTMKVVDSGFLVLCESARWTMVFKLRYIYKKLSQVVVNDNGPFIRKMTLRLIGLTRLITADFWAWTLFCLIWAYDGPFV